MRVHGRLRGTNLARAHIDVQPLVGQNNKFELWDREKWQQAIDSGAGFGDGELPPELEGFSL